MVEPQQNNPETIAGEGNLSFEKGQADIKFLIANIPDYSIIMVDPAGYIQSWNLGAELTQGYKADEIIGQHFSKFYTKPDIDRNHPQEELRLALMNGRYEEEGWRVRKDGVQFWANVIITPLRDGSGNLVGFAKITRDLTEKKKAEEALRKANEELEAFSYSVSHDLRAPLRSMDGFSEVLQTILSDKLDERSRSYLNRIRESAKKMSTLIDDLLNLSRLGRSPLTKQKVNLSELAEKILQELKKSDPHRNVEIQIEPDLMASVDPNLIRVVLENLLNNAWKYTSKTENARIEFGGRHNSEGQQEFFIKDNGAGFDMEFSDKLFGAFQRLHGVNEFPGNGIGLATVKRIINKHQGEVRAEGKPNQGATFYFTLES